MSRSVMVVVGVLIAMLASAGPAVSGTSSLQPSFFSSFEVRSDNLAPFRKWQGALMRAAEERLRAHQEACSNSRGEDRCPYQTWEAFLEGLRGKDRWQQVLAVNRYMNDYVYVSDPSNWGVEDYWESPGEFLTRFGDCEDYAIAKYMSLRRLGWSDDELRIAAVLDLNLRVGHAVIIVYYGGHTWLLDNQIKTVVDTERIYHYQPVFSINQTAWWRHLPRSE